MDNSNIKVYLGISFALIILLILIIIIPFSKKSTNNNLQPTTSVPFPTSVATNSTNLPAEASAKAGSTNIPANFTGVAEEQLPAQVLDTALQKKDLRSKVPVNFGTFSINFDYSQDKFTVTLTYPKDQAQKEFENWRTANYPGLGSEQFLLK